MKSVTNTIQSNTSNINIKNLCSEIDAGKVEGKGGIKLKPFYQRDYKFTKKDESFLIESLLMGIPIPTIYLASDTTKFPHVSNVIDGQHRLRAIHRFINNEYSLTGLETLDGLNKSHFEDLPNVYKNKLLFQTSLTVNYIHVQNDYNLELEIFLRYNKGTNPMSKQEIRHVLFGSPFNDWVINVVDQMKDDSTMKEVFNIVKKRISEKNVHADVFLMLSILHYGLNKKHGGTPSYVDEIMSKAREMSNEESKIFIEHSNYLLSNFQGFIEYIRSLGITYIFSKEIYDPEKKHHLFQGSILMIIAHVFKYILENKIDYKSQDENILICIKNGIRKSNFFGATSATTNFDLVSNAVNFIKGELVACDYK